MDLMPKKSILNEQEKIIIEGNIYCIQSQLNDRYLMELPEQYVQEEWFRMYKNIIQEIAKMGMSTRDYFVLKIIPSVQETHPDYPWSGTTLRLKAEINAVQHKEISVPVPHFEPYPVTLKYLYKQWKSDMKYNIRKWWKGLWK
jgi:hypothetical protein